MNFDNPRTDASVQENQALSRKRTRRQLLMQGAARAATFALSASVAAETLDLMYPEYAEAVEILNPNAEPDRSFEQCPALAKTLDYPIPDPSHWVLGAGDSIIVGPDGNEQDTITQQIAVTIKNAGVGTGAYANVAHQGDTTQQAILQLYKPEAIRLLTASAPTTVFTNVGSDDLKDLVRTSIKVRMLEQLAKHPHWQDAREAYDVALSVIATLDEVQANYEKLLEKIAVFKHYKQSPYGNGLRIAVNFGADWSKVPLLTVSEDGGHDQEVVLSGYEIGFVQRVSAKLNGRIANAVTAFMQRHPDMQVVATNPFDQFTRKSFKKDEHLASDGKLIIVRDCLNRMTFAGLPLHEAEKRYIPDMYYNPDDTRHYT